VAEIGRLVERDWGYGSAARVTDGLPEVRRVTGVRRSQDGVPHITNKVNDLVIVTFESTVRINCSNQLFELTVLKGGRVTRRSSY
jgi:hypothetical protein